LILVPTQLGKHFWPEWSLVDGIRIDYLAPTWYLTDILWVFWIATSFNWKDFWKKTKKYWWVGVLVVINVLMAKNGWVAGIKWLRWGALVITIFNLKFEIFKAKEKLLKVIPYWIGGETLIGVAQVINAGSLGGIFWWLGERTFDLSTIGIAQIEWWGEKTIRAYGTFSHPNSLAGFLLVSWWWFSQNQKERRIGWWIVWWMGLIGILISGSRTVWLITGILIIKKIVEIYRVKRIKALGFGLMVAGIVVGVMALMSWNFELRAIVGGWDSESLKKRWDLTVVAMKMIKDNWLWGVGANNFLVEIKNYYSGWWQPVHNIFLLLLTEVGLIGGGVVAMFLRKLKWKKIYWLIILTGLVDHYWITLPQNWWLMAIILGL